jgi:hypothetical protein
MGFVLAGLGHLYVGEYARAALVFVSAVAAAVGVYLAGPIGLVSLAILVFSARDAHLGARHLNEERRPRPLSGGIWAVVLVAAVVLTVGIAIGSSGASGASNTGDIEGQIKPDLERQLQDRLSDPSLTVDSVSCVNDSASGGTCLAAVSDATGSDNVSITYSVDASSGDMLWRVTP